MACQTHAAARHLEFLHVLNRRLERGEITPAEATDYARRLYERSRERQLDRSEEEGKPLAEVCQIERERNRRESLLRAAIAGSPAYYAALNDREEEGPL